MNFSKDRGGWGEKIAAEYLQKRGFEVVDSNYRCKAGEIDLIVAAKKELHFVEVKMRTQAEFGAPLEAIGYGKQAKMSRAAQTYLMKYPKWQQNTCLLSVVSIEVGENSPPKVEFIPNAFEIVSSFY